MKKIRKQQIFDELRKFDSNHQGNSCDRVNLENRFLKEVERYQLKTGAEKLTLSCYKKIANQVSEDLDAEIIALSHEELQNKKVYNLGEINGPVYVNKFIELTTEKKHINLEKELLQKIVIS